MAGKKFVGIGFGAIQGGLFLYEAFQSQQFDQLVVGEVVPEVVEAVRRNGGKYRVNVATPSGIRRTEITGIEILNPRDAADREALIRHIATATEIATALPSVQFFGEGKAGDVVDIVSHGLRAKIAEKGPRCILYTAENHNHAAEILDEKLRPLVASPAYDDYCQVLNTVIGKMSGVVNDAAQIEEQTLAPMTPAAPRALLVEEFNRILITRIHWNEFERGIRVFEEKADLLPFEEAKLYGHNATHALLAYTARLQGCTYISDAADQPALMDRARRAFVEESGRALCKKYSGLDPLFTEAGYRAYVEDLLVRMVNPHLRDQIERVARDPKRKLSWNDRLVGTMRMALSQGVEPKRYAVGAAAALRMLGEEDKRPAAELLDAVWQDAPATDRAAIRDRILEAQEEL